MKRYKITINGNPYDVAIKRVNQGEAVVEVNGSEYHVDILEEPVLHKTPQIVRRQEVYDVSKRPVQTRAADRVAPSSGVIKAPLPGLILEVSIKEGDEIKIGQQVLRMEAMKMENNIQSNRDGRVVSVRVKKGDSVLEGDILAEIGD
ncbi:biotin/lipoyl-binding protein [candidate division KSB1 bacterium]|nr:biotin/lipoyl-binding protein [candidate division KSB1 bacterium]